MEIRVAEEKDCKELHALIIKTWRETYPSYIAKQGEEAIAHEIADRFSIEKVQSYLKDINRRLWVVTNSQNNMVGYAHIILPKENKKPAFLDQIYLIQEEQGKGLGTILLQQCYSYLKEKNISGLELEVDVDNEKAVNFYKKQGFQVMKKVPYDEVHAPGYFDYVMEKTIIKSPGIYGLWAPEEKKEKEQIEYNSYSIA
ncbi:N-terminal GNAT family acetyltransferase [Legionella beliardensis]|uniref:N-terminal GNAT family acetyltransferase n=1 Tax=Legionella beliardensis TaxID=91822 RepID=A0A378I2N0_9GAMM|nr:GNAT family N-acetyltransferase [Legionella beliardensis]STX28955.1 N-terminal GNAT family acetyltransferase [Legionella beliardensis]